MTPSPSRMRSVRWLRAPYTISGAGGPREAGHKMVLHEPHVIEADLIGADDLIHRLLEQEVIVQLRSRHLVVQAQLHASVPRPLSLHRTVALMPVRRPPRTTRGERSREASDRRYRTSVTDAGKIGPRQEAFFSHREHRVDGWIGPNPLSTMVERAGGESQGMLAESRAPAATPARCTGDTGGVRHDRLDLREVVRGQPDVERANVFYDLARGDDMPTSARLTAGWWSTHASASWATLARGGDGRGSCRRSTTARFCRRLSGANKPGAEASLRRGSVSGVGRLRP